jgi:hypothetical protein
MARKQQAWRNALGTGRSAAPPFAIFYWLTWLLSVAHADAPPEQAAPPDAIALRRSAVEGDMDPPVLPSEFRTARVGQVTWAYHPSIASLAEELQRSLPRKLRVVSEELGLEDPGSLEIRVARSPDEMRRLSPQNGPPPAYAVGVAYPAMGLIVLSTVTPESWLPPDVGQVLTHELSHVMLHRAVAEQPVPLWFAEGLAVAQAGEHRLARVRALWEAAISDDALPLSSLSQSFPVDSVHANLAYAQSADLVQHLTQDARGKERLRKLVGSIANGTTFEAALLGSHHIDMLALENEFRRSLSERFRVLPMVLTGTALWGGIAVLAVVAFLGRRRKQREQLAVWEREEAADLRKAALQYLSPVRVEPSNNQEDERLAVLIRLPEPGVPTVEHEGQRHTLH